MVAIGLLDAELRPADRFTSEGAHPVRPGSKAPTMATSSRKMSPRLDETTIGDRVTAEAEYMRDRALHRVELSPTANTWARLAQAYAALCDDANAVSAARASIALASAADTTSVRIAAEILTQHGDALSAYDALLPMEKSTALAITFATVAHELGRTEEALDSLSGREGPLVESFIGFLLVSREEYQKAVGHLRSALFGYPEDADAAMNLAVALFAMGAKKKAIASALRASRTAPGRKDLSLGYLEMLLEVGDVARAASEIRRLDHSGVIADAHSLVIQARVRLMSGEPARALALLGDALAEAKSENNPTLEAEIAANRETLRYDLGKIDRDSARRELASLMKRFPDNDAVLLNFCHVVHRRSEAPELRRAFEHLDAALSPERRAYVRHQLAVLEGDSEGAASSALDWFELEKDNPAAASAAVLALGIGLQRWKEAEKVARFALETIEPSASLANNAAYAIAMAGYPLEAKKILEPWMNSGFVVKATMGLACLAHDELQKGMRLYREAAAEAERVDFDSRSLMAIYQALIVRQLGLYDGDRRAVLEATALVPVELPDDWKDRPDFLRLRNACLHNGYSWPLSL